MWSRALRRPFVGISLHRTVRFARKYNGQSPSQYGVPHTTYFQQPAQPDRPPRRSLRTVLLATGFFLLGSITGTVLSPWIVDIELLDEDEHNRRAVNSFLDELPTHELKVAVNAMKRDISATKVPYVDLKHAQVTLENGKGGSLGVSAIGHNCTLPSNMPCEDTMVSGEYTFFSERAKNWAFWCIFDGHAGPRTANVLTDFLPGMLGERLHATGCMTRGYIPNDNAVIQTIKGAFRAVDDAIMRRARDAIENSGADLSFKYLMAAPVLSGSCALVTLFDPTNSVLRVANTGDSRAVLGRWDEAAGKYIAKPMSIDQTGFNQDEVARLRREHPGEDVVDPETGRVHGIAVSRAFGDARWKWPNELTRSIHETLFGPAPRPNGVIKTPPYLTAEPEIMETRIQTGPKPDFLIMASDGLWDNMSSEDAVTCVQMWLDNYKPGATIHEDDTASFEEKMSKPPFDLEGPGSSQHYDTTSDNETYYDENERSMRWRVSPKHFVVEDDHAGLHLIKNALGGSRRSLFCGIMGVQPPLSRNVRDDITVEVIFFGVEMKGPLLDTAGRPVHDAKGKLTKRQD